ncbi:MAG: type VI secretion system tip protein VgrG [Polyangiaceae bacterium]|nr:type VI secretion system tip protein VgrG [Polyangiaceae bacterium]
MMQSPAGLAIEIDTEDKFDVRECSIEDGLSSLFQVEVVAMSDNPAVDFEALVGRDATMKVELSAAAHPGEGPRLWKGIVSEIHQLGAEEDGLSSYSITVVPKLWLLSQRTNCRVFQQMTDLDIAQALLKEWGISPQVQVARTLKTKKYRVQYHESDFVFLCRVLESAGITFFHKQDGEETVLVLSDSPEQADARKQPLQHLSEPALGTLWATGLKASRRMRHGKVTFADHDHRMPNEPLLGEASAGGTSVEAKLERFEYTPGAFRFGGKGPADTPTADDRGRSRTDPGEAKRLADQKAAGLIARSQRYSFQTNALDVASGMVLKMNGHARAEQAEKFLITRYTLSASTEMEPTLSVDAVSAKNPYRPEMITPQPVVQGVEMATVVGPSGETIHCDEFGRVRVQFHWDRYGSRDHKSSCWIHVNQPWAGDGMGAINIPRIGQEVIVDFLGGNPEEPVIVGRIFTHLLRPPMSLPANKTQNGFKSASVPATGGFNELMFEDAAGKELLRMRAEKDMKTLVNNDQDTKIGNKRSTHVESDDKETVGGNQSKSVLGNLAQTVVEQAVSQVLSHAASFVGGHQLTRTKGNHALSAAAHSITSEKGTVLQVGNSTIYIGPDAVIIQSPKVLLNPGEDVLASAVLTGSIPSTAGQ